MQVVACSPLAKIFLREWEEPLLENPDLILDETVPFTFTVPRSVGAIENVKYGVPFRIEDALKGSIEARDAKAGQNVLYYLTGGSDGTGMQPTDWTGIVELDQNINERAMAEMQHVIMQAQMSGDKARLDRARQQSDALMDKAWEHTKESMKRARALADQRVVRQLKTTHINLMSQYKHNKEDGKGLYQPSCPEHFGAYVLRNLIKVSKGRQSMNSNFNAWVQDVGLGA